MKFFIGFFLLMTISVFAQFDPKIEEYQHYTIFKNKDTINYHVFEKNHHPKEGVILFVHGSGSAPLFNVKKEEDRTLISSSVPFNLDQIPDNYLFVIVSKKCVPFSVINQIFYPPTCFYQNEGLDYRVWQNHLVIKDVLKNKIRNPKKVIVIGHSEGSDVVAKLGTINPKITHLGYWAGGGNTQYYDFALFIRRQSNEGKINEETAKVKLDSLFNQLKEFKQYPHSITQKWEDNTYKRWEQFSEPPINHLLKINIPIFVAVGAKDQAVPVESSLLIPIEFIRHRKTNLTFKLYPHYDHSFFEIPNNENENLIPHWMDVFNEFMQWTFQ